MLGISHNVTLCYWEINAGLTRSLIWKWQNPTAQVEHEATTSKIGEDQIFYCNQRGISTEDAIGLIIKGYAGDVINKMPMEFAVEAQKLLQISLAGSVG